MAKLKNQCHLTVAKRMRARVKPSLCVVTVREGEERATSTVNITTQSPEVSRRRVEAATWGSANSAAAASGLSQNMAALSLGAPATLPALHFCPVQGCLSAAGGRRPGWETDGQDFRNHVDAHQLEQQFPGLLPKAWMNSRRMVQSFWTHGEQALQQRHAPHLSGF